MPRRNSKSPNVTEIIIPVIGLNGAGKSTFINTAVDGPVARVDHGILSCTKDIQSFRIVDPRDDTRFIVFVDTPGFDPTFGSDIDILKSISVWLRRMYSDQKTVAGIIYLWDVSQTRDTTRHILDLFCTTRPPKNVVVATTKWQVPPSTDEGEREKVLRNYLKEPAVPQFQMTHASAWDIVDRVIRQGSFDVKLLLKRLEAYSHTSSGRMKVGAKLIAQFRKLFSA